MASTSGFNSSPVMPTHMRGMQAGGSCRDNRFLCGPSLYQRGENAGCKGYMPEKEWKVAEWMETDATTGLPRSPWNKVRRLCEHRVPGNTGALPPPGLRLQEVCLTSLDLSCLFCKMGLLIAPPSQACQDQVSHNIPVRPQNGALGVVLVQEGDGHCSAQGAGEGSRGVPHRLCQGPSEGVFAKTGAGPRWPQTSFQL